MFGFSFDAIVAVHDTARLPDWKFGVKPELAASPYSQMPDKVFASELHMDTPRVQTQIVSRRKGAFGDRNSIGFRHTFFIQRSNSSN
jgi:hypothetical protein